MMKTFCPIERRGGNCPKTVKECRFCGVSSCQYEPCQFCHVMSRYLRCRRCGSKWAV